jgi:hypothetical protein
MTFTDHYDMCMTFLRYQECYESPNRKFRKKQFTLVDFMEWYSKKQSQGSFEYPKHWAGFNVPSYVFNNVCGMHKDGKLIRNNDELVDWMTNSNWSDLILDYNKYDAIMEGVYNKCTKASYAKYGESSFYLIGAMEGNLDTINHEVAHGFFYTTPSYKKEMSVLVQKLNPTFRKKLYESLAKIGYTKEVFVDEAQAFLATGWREFFPKLKSQDAPFIEVFDRYNSIIK